MFHKFSFWIVAARVFCEYTPQNLMRKINPGECANGTAMKMNTFSGNVPAMSLSWGLEIKEEG